MDRSALDRRVNGALESSPAVRRQINFALRIVVLLSTASHSPYPKWVKPMSWPTPQIFPSRNRFPYNPGIADRQLWALGMVVAQWSMTESLMHNHVLNLVGAKTPLWDDYNNQASFRHQATFWQTQAETKLSNPQRAAILALIAEARRVKNMRDRATHGLWGGGIQSGSWNNPEDHATTDGQLIHEPGTNLKWNLTFARIREIAVEVATLNQRLFEATLLPPTP